MEGTNHELKILLSNIKIKKDELDYVKLDGFIAKSKFQVPYIAGDLILYDQFRELALVLEVKPDLLRILTP
jgi:hypothetical protein